MSSSKWLRIFCWFVTIVSLADFWGWFTHNIILVQFNAEWTPMQFNTALGILLTAQALRGLTYENKKWTLIFSALLCLVTGLTVVEYLGGINLGIDTLFGEPFTVVGTRYAGRMGLNTAICLFAMGFSMLLNLKKGVSSFIGVSLSSLVGWLGFLSLLSYFIDINTDFAWGSASRMAIHTALCMMLLGFAVPVAIYQNRHEKFHGVSLSYFIVFAFTSLTAVVTQALIQTEIKQTKEFFDLRADSMAREVRDNFMARNEAFERMAQRWMHSVYKSKEDWMVDADLYYHDIKGIQGIAWINSHNMIHWVYPYKGNELLQDRDITVRPRSVQNVATAKQRRKVFITSPLDLVVGGFGFALLYPLFKTDTGAYDGIITVTYKFANMFPNILMDRDYYVEVYESNQLLYKANANDIVLHEKWKSVHDIDVINRHWRLVISPTPAILQRQTTYVPLMILCFGFFISTLLGFAVLLYYRTRSNEEQMWVASEWERAITGSSQFLIISVDEHWVLKSFNRAAENLLEYSADDVIGKSTPAILHEPEDLPAVYKALEKAGQGKIETNEWTLVSKTGKRYRCAITLSPIFNNQNQISGYVGIGEDVTLKKIQEAKLISSARLSSLGEMAAGIAHEINNPLTIIAAHASSIRRSLESREGSSQAEISKLDKIEKTVQRIARIIRGLRNFARESSGDEKQLVEVVPMIDETLSFCAERFKNSGIELEVEVAEGLSFRGQALQISQVVLNLLNNAYDAVKDQPVKVVRLRARPSREGVEISVEDSGPGVPENLREKIMQPFFTTKEVGDGLGLGLSISRGIAQAHEGTLSLDLNSERTRFVLWVPVKK